MSNSVYLRTFSNPNFLCAAEAETGISRRPSRASGALRQLLNAQYVPDGAAKDEFATNARLMCIAHAATAAVMALEAWAQFAKPGEKFDETEPPSESLDRREMIVRMGESHSGQKQKCLPIIRSVNGKFFDFGESEAPAMDKMKGRFAQPLPTKVPDVTMRDLAKAMLTVKGVAPAIQGGRLPPHKSRRFQSLPALRLLLLETLTLELQRPAIL